MAKLAVSTTILLCCMKKAGVYLKKAPRHR